jgi:hypothetical protein
MTAGFGPANGPTESQCSYINKMAEALDIDLGYDWQSSWTKQEASDWIDEHQADYEVLREGYNDGF